MIFTDIFIVMKKNCFLIIISLILLYSINSQDLSSSISNFNNSPNIISEIKTISTDNTIEISFNNSRSDRELVIYRSSEPINNYNDILKASLIATISSSTNIFIDHPQAGIPYFYIIMDSILTRSGQYTIKSDQNVTSKSTLIQAVNSGLMFENRETLRNQPLPYLDLKSSIDTGKLLLDSYSEIPVKYSLTFESKNIIQTLVQNTYQENTEELKTVILEEDLASSANSEQYQLKRIIESDFSDKNWINAYKLLTNYLSVEHSPLLEIRAHFYRAQVLYFQNRYNESFMEFVLIYEDLPHEAKPWMDKLITLLRINN
jgi:hypothetical protein